MNQNGSILKEVLDLVGKCLTPESARAVLDFKLNPTAQTRLDELAERNAEGTLTPDERREHEGQVGAIEITSILQARARRLLGTKVTAS